MNNSQESFGNCDVTSQVESEESDVLNKKRSNHCQRKMEARKGPAKIASQLEEQFTTGRLYGKEFVFVLSHMVVTSLGKQDSMPPPAHFIDF